MSNTTAALGLCGWVLLEAGCASAPEGPEGDLGKVAFHLGGGYGERQLRGLPLAADDLTTIYVEALAGERASALVSSDAAVFSVESMEGVTVCATFTLIGPCDHVSTDDVHARLRTAGPGRAVLRALRDDGTVLDEIPVDVRRFAGFGSDVDLPWRFGSVGSERTFHAVAVDEGGDAVWLGQEPTWTAPEDRLDVTSRHRQGGAHAIRAIGLAPGPGELVLSGPGASRPPFRSWSTEDMTARVTRHRPPHPILSVDATGYPR